jgi:ATP-dependent DNA helicase HFM1/MER3
MTGMVAIFIAKKEYRSIISALKLSQGIKCQLWDNSSLKARQIDGVGPVIAKAFSKAGIDSFIKLCSYDVSRLNMIAGRNPPFGTRIIEAASKFPQLTMSLLHIQPVTMASLGNQNQKLNLNVEITVKIGLQNPGTVLKFMKNTPIVYYFIAGTSLGNLIETRRFPVSKLVLDQMFTFKTRLKSEKESILCSMICCEIGTIFVFFSH